MNKKGAIILRLPCVKKTKDKSSMVVITSCNLSCNHSCNLFCCRSCNRFYSCLSLP